MNDKIVKKIGIKQDTGKYIYANIGVDADKVEINESMNLAEKIVEIDNKINNIEVGIYELPIASEETLGGVKIGNGLEIMEDGTLNCTMKGGVSYTPIANISAIFPYKEKGYSAMENNSGILPFLSFNNYIAITNNSEILPYTLIEED